MPIKPTRITFTAIAHSDSWRVIAHARTMENTNNIPQHMRDEMRNYSKRMLTDDEVTDLREIKNAADALALESNISHSELAVAVGREMAMDAWNRAIDTAAEVASDSAQFAAEHSQYLSGVDADTIATIYSLAVGEVAQALRAKRMAMAERVEVGLADGSHIAQNDNGAFVHEAKPPVVHFFLSITVDEPVITVRGSELLIERLTPIMQQLENVPRCEFKFGRSYIVYGEIDSADRVVFHQVSEHSTRNYAEEELNWKDAAIAYFVPSNGVLVPVTKQQAEAITKLGDSQQSAAQPVRVKPIDKHVGNYSHFIELLRKLSAAIHTTALEHGWWNDELGGNPRNDAECIALMHSELSEALEALRSGPQARGFDGRRYGDELQGKISEHIPEFLAIEEEYADVIIRVLDHAYARGWNVAGALAAKMEYNDGRPYKHGGKHF